MTQSEKKLSVLKNGKKIMNPGGNRTSEVNSKVSEVKAAFKEYIKSDNISSSEYVTERLKVTVEEHGDFDAAVYYINRAIAITQEKVNEEKSERNKD